ncbi:hypothetical protein WKI71_36720 [Streptomyces sp. MS1.AVA.1]|uniref:Uncharacterized protein n=1 Tax=Streptomyces machairae TaxID=3134109 RepID=A0ABU8UTG4_9ACTN
MAELLAHVALLGRHRRTTIVGGYHWQYCGHRSHRRGLPCWRWSQWDGFCVRHNRSCWTYCHKEPS